MRRNKEGSWEFAEEFAEYVAMYRELPKLGAALDFAVDQLDWSSAKVDGMRPADLENLVDTVTCGESVELSEALRIFTKEMLIFENVWIVVDGRMVPPQQAVDPGFKAVAPDGGHVVIHARMPPVVGDLGTSQLHGALEPFAKLQQRFTGALAMAAAATSTALPSHDVVLNEGTIMKAAGFDETGALLRMPTLKQKLIEVFEKEILQAWAQAKGYESVRLSV